jgi:hypothetical protein
MREKCRPLSICMRVNCEATKGAGPFDTNCSECSSEWDRMLRRLRALEKVARRATTISRYHKKRNQPLRCECGLCDSIRALEEGSGNQQGEMTKGTQQPGDKILG